MISILSPMSFREKHSLFITVTGELEKIMSFLHQEEKVQHGSVPACSQ